MNKAKQISNLDVNTPPYVQ